MTPRERVLLAINHQQTDIVPYHIIYTSPIQKKLEEYYQTSKLDDVIGNHIVKYRLRIPDVEVSPDHWRDGYNLIWDRTVDKDIGVVTNYPLTKRDLSLVTFPNPKDERIYQGLPKFIEENPQRFRMASIGFALFERAWSLRNMQELLIDMIEAPDFVHELFEAITQTQLAILDEALKYDLDAILFGDDWGQQNGLIFGIRLWRKFIKPYIARLYDKSETSWQSCIHS
jgi:uroporphyrinogen decarboxylase